LVAGDFGKPRLLAAGGLTGLSRGEPMKLNLDRIAAIREAELIEDSDICKQWALNLILAALLDGSFLGSERNKPRLNNDDVVRLAHWRISESVIVRIIELYDGDYEVSSRNLVSLCKSGTGGRVIKAMLSKELKETPC
jgi:hypothetical protein